MFYEFVLLVLGKTQVRRENEFNIEVFLYFPIFSEMERVHVQLSSVVNK